MQLLPQPALRLALILHELATNALKYGAFSRPAGRVVLEWSVEGDRLQLRWQESGGPPVQTPVKRGFGSTLIDSSMKSDGGTASVSYRNDGVVWELVMPLDRTPDPMADIAARPVTPAPLEPAREVPALDGRRLLVVEDEALVALELIAVLEDAGASVHGPARTVEEALEAIETGAFSMPPCSDGNPARQAGGRRRGGADPARHSFAFVSGYGRENLPAAFAQAPV